MKSNRNKNAAKSNPEEEYDNLLQEFQERSQPQETVQNSNTAPLKNRAQKLLVWITLHKNHVDRHELADICKEGKELIEKIMKSTNNIDTSELDFELMVLEARKTACEEAFAEDMKGFDSITPEIIDSLPPQVQVSIKARISQAKLNIYSTIDTPGKILDEIQDMQYEGKINHVNNIISQTLNSNPSYSHIKEHINHNDLYNYIYDRIDYMKYEEVIEQVKTLLNSINTAYESPTGYILPRDLRNFIDYYNSKVKILEDLNSTDSNRYKKLNINDVLSHEQWFIDTFSSDIQFRFSFYDSDIKEMQDIIDEIESNRLELINRITNYFAQNNIKPTHVDQWKWDYNRKRLIEIHDELIRGKLHNADRDLTGYLNNITALMIWS